MSKKIVILKPRLDVTFKYFGPVASERKPIEPHFIGKILLTI